MAERYSKLFYLPENLYVVGSPLLVMAGALLKDNQTGRILAQLKLKSLSPKDIKAVKVQLYPLDTVNNPLDGETVYEYLDLHVKRDEEFGQKNAIYLPNASTRAFSLKVTEVAFEDNSVWPYYGEPWEALPTPPSLEKDLGDAELVKQYKIKFGQKSIVKPQKMSDIWYCTCGAVNDIEEDACHVCGNRISALLACNMEELTVAKDNRVSEEKEEQLKKAAADYEAAQKRKRRLSIILPLLAACLAAIVVFIKIILPSINYKKAINSLAAGQYETACTLFMKLGDYKDSKEQVAALVDSLFTGKEFVYEEETDYNYVEYSDKTTAEIIGAPGFYSKHKNFIVWENDNKMSVIELTTFYDYYDYHFQHNSAKVYSGNYDLVGFSDKMLTIRMDQFSAAPYSNYGTEKQEYYSFLEYACYKPEQRYFIAIIQFDEEMNVINLTGEWKRVGT